MCSWPSGAPHLYASKLRTCNKSASQLSSSSSSQSVSLAQPPSERSCPLDAVPALTSVVRPGLPPRPGGADSRQLQACTVQVAMSRLDTMLRLIIIFTIAGLPQLPAGCGCWRMAGRRGERPPVQPAAPAAPAIIQQPRLVCRPPLQEGGVVYRRPELYAPLIQAARKACHHIPGSVWIVRLAAVTQMVVYQHD